MKYLLLSLAFTVLLSTGCTSVLQGKSSFTVTSSSVLGIGGGYESAENAIPAGGKITNVNHMAMLFGIFKSTTIGGTK